VYAIINDVNDSVLPQEGHDALTHKLAAYGIAAWQIFYIIVILSELRYLTLPIYSF